MGGFSLNALIDFKIPILNVTLIENLFRAAELKGKFSLNSFLKIFSLF